MKITITNVERAPQWKTVQELVRDITGDPEGVFVSIDRTDGGVNYQGVGMYSVVFLTKAYRLPLTVLIARAC